MVIVDFVDVFVECEVVKVGGKVFFFGGKFGGVVVFGDDEDDDEDDDVEKN